eukprot:1275829-Rhodomonas_salina.4
MRGKVGGSKVPEGSLAFDACYFHAPLSVSDSVSVSDAWPSLVPSTLSAESPTWSLSLPLSVLSVTRGLCLPGLPPPPHAAPTPTYAAGCLSASEGTVHCTAKSNTRNHLFSTTCTRNLHYSLALSLPAFLSRCVPRVSLLVHLSLSVFPSLSPCVCLSAGESVSESLCPSPSLTASLYLCAGMDSSGRANEVEWTEGYDVCSMFGLDAARPPRGRRST